MPPPPLSVSTAGNLTSRSSHPFSRDATKNALVAKLTSRLGSSGTHATQTKLLDTLKAANNEVAKTLSKAAGGARRVPIKDTQGATTTAVASSSTAAAAVAPIPAVQQALEARVAALESDKLKLAADLATLRSENDSLRSSAAERDAAFAHLKLQLTEAQATIAALQAEKGTLSEQAVSAPAVDAEAVSASVPLCIVAPADEPIASDAAVPTALTTDGAVAAATEPMLADGEADTEPASDDNVHDSLNLSLNASSSSLVMGGGGTASAGASPFHAGALPASFMSPRASTPSLAAHEEATKSLQGLLSPISASPAIPAAAAASTVSFTAPVHTPAAMRISVTSTSLLSHSHVGLSESSIKIQDRLRQYNSLKAEERLRALTTAMTPSATPSASVRPSCEPTPLQAEQPAESPVHAAKRQRSNQWPSATEDEQKDKSQLHDSGLDGLLPCLPDAFTTMDEEEGLLAQRELSFGTAAAQDNEDEEEEDDEVSFDDPEGDAPTAPVPSAAVAAAAAYVSASPAPAAAAASVAATATPSTLNKSTSHLASLSSADAKRLSTELKAARSNLGTIEADWSARSKSLCRLEQLVKERGTGGMAGWGGWRDELAALQRPMAAQLADLRSSILRDACRVLVALAEASPREFEESGQLAFYAPHLWKGLYVTIKVISQTSGETLTTLTALSASVRSVPVFLACQTDTHSVVREKCANYLGQIVASCPPVSSGSAAAAELESTHLPTLLAAAKTQMQATDGPVRAAWRQLWAALRSRYPSPHTAMDSVASELPGPVVKALEQDRRAREGVTGSATVRVSALAGIKRKK